MGKWMLWGMLLLLLGGCAGAAIQPDPRDSNAPPQGVVLLEPVWPQNAYTEGVPVPPGDVAWAMLDTEHENCAVSMVDVDEDDYADYLEALEQAGFSLVETASEEVQGQGYLSSGSLLCNGETWLGIAATPGSCTLYLSPGPCGDGPAS